MRWKILAKETKKEVEPQRGSTSEPSKKLKEIIETLLVNRGLKTKKQIEEFLNPSLNHLTIEPLNYVGINKVQLNKAIKRIKKALKIKQPIIVYSDYDADGICGAAILWETLHALDAKVMPYVPHRIKEGYGLSSKGIDNIFEQIDKMEHIPKAVNPLIITVDHGITANKQVAYAKEKGFDVIITDHHTFPKKLPKAEAIVHTTKLSGSGVAYLLSSQLNLTIVSKKVTFEHLALAALGTIADLVPLVGPNRVIAKFGLEELNKTTRVGLKVLIKEAGLREREISTYEVSFILAPRLNAAGRLTHALDSLRLLCTKDKKRAERLAKLLNQTNQERQTIMKQATEHASSSVRLLLQDDDRHKPARAKLLFVSHESYHEGIIGLVAGKLAEKFYRPSIVVSQGKERSKASARSVNGFNIIEAIRSCSDLLVDCGGHPMAAGFTVETKHLELVQKRLLQLADKQLSADLLTKELKIDCEIDLADITWDLYKEIKKFQPFGVGNPEPVFASRKVKVIEARVVGTNGGHLKLKLADLSNSNCLSYDAIAFGLGHLYPQLTSNQIDIAYTLFADVWNGQKSLQLKVKEIKLQ